MDESIVNGSILYFAVYLLVLFLVSLILTAMGVDVWSAFPGTAAWIGTIGPGFGMVGSAANYDFIPGLGKLALSFIMLLGRPHTSLGYLTPLEFSGVTQKFKAEYSPYDWTYFGETLRSRKS